MNMLAWLDESFSLRLAETLLHFHWQGCAIGLIAIVVGRVFRRASANVRYSLDVAAMLVLVSCVPVTFSLIDVQPPAFVRVDFPKASTDRADQAAGTIIKTGAASAVVQDQAPTSLTSNTSVSPTAVAPSSWWGGIGAALGRWSSWLNRSARYLTAAYFVGAGLMLIRLAVALRGGRQLSRSAMPIGPGSLLTMVQQQARRMGMKVAPAVAYCEQISVPIVVGIIRPTILLPAALIIGLSPHQLESLVTHELAHIRRFDLFVILLQRLTESLLFFHPAVWLISGRLSSERESAADDIVVATGFRPIDYADALLRMAELSHSLRSVPEVERGVVLAASGEKPSELRRRIVRLIGGDDRPKLRLTRLGFSMFMAVLALAAFSPLLVQAWESRDNSVAKLDRATPTRAFGNRWNVKVRAVDETTGAPIPNPRVFVQLGKVVTSFDGDTNGEYTAVIPSRTPRYCYLRIRAKGYTPMEAFWSQRRGQPPDALPEVFTFSMAKAMSVGGVVVDEDGKPIAGATVLFSAGDRKSHPSRRAVQSFYDEKYITDAKGRWTCAIAPPKMSGGSINVAHPDFAVDTSTMSVDHQIEQIKLQTHSWTLKRGFIVRGRVTDPGGNPVEGAILAIGELNGYPHKGPFPATDEDGRYTFERVASRNFEVPVSNDQPNRKTITVVKPGFAPMMQSIPGFGPNAVVPPDPQERIVDFQLQRGETVRIQVVDSDGKPLQGIRVLPDGWRDTGALQALRQFGFPRETNEEGVWQWTWAPVEEPVKYGIVGRGFMDIRGRELTVEPGGLKTTIMMRRPQVLVGRVIDAETKQPIDEFVVEKGFVGIANEPDGIWWTDRSRGQNGQFRRAVTTPTSPGYRFRVLAEGYESEMTEIIPVEEGELSLSFELNKSASTKTQANRSRAKKDIELESDPPRDDNRESQSKSSQKEPAANARQDGPLIVNAEHVLLWGGDEIVTWDEVVRRLRALRKSGPIHAEFYSTNGFHRSGENAWQDYRDRVMALYRELFEPADVSFVRVSPRGSRRLDEIRTAADLRPNPQRARKGRVLTPEGRPAVGAQVIVLPTKEQFASLDVALADTRMRDPLGEQWSPTDAAGEFIVYPEDDDYLLAILHESGTAYLYRSENVGDVRLEPWVTLTFASTDDVAFQRASVSVKPAGAKAEDPGFTVFTVKTEGKPFEVRVPTGRIVAKRTVRMERGSTISLPVQTLTLKPGQRKTLKLDPPSTTDRKRAEELKNRLDGFRKKKP